MWKYITNHTKIEDDEIIGQIQAYAEA